MIGNLLGPFGNDDPSPNLGGDTTIPDPMELPPSGRSPSTEVGKPNTRAPGKLFRGGGRGWRLRGALPLIQLIPGILEDLDRYLRAREACQSYMDQLREDIAPYPHIDVPGWGTVPNMMHTITI